jgi:pantoate--beta-alanine ligase
MLLFNQTEKLQTYLQRMKKAGKTIGFVPTMGALHEGHLSLIRLSHAQHDLTVCSIFVNPTQFNDPEDLRRYPRQVSSDAAMLESENCNVLFCPLVSEIYPEGASHAAGPDLPLHGLDQTMEGAHRPGHFRGVLQVVYRLLDVVHPDTLYLGQKDAQQHTIIRHMIDTLLLPVELVIGPTVREKDGLAMSSRNALLTQEARSAAPRIYKALQMAAQLFGTTPVPEIRRKAIEFLNQPPLEPEYFEIVDPRTLQPIDSTEECTEALACAAVKAGEVRLIDNTLLKTQA